MVLTAGAAVVTATGPVFTDFSVAVRNLFTEVHPCS